MTITRKYAVHELGTIYTTHLLKQTQWMYKNYVVSWVTETERKIGLLPSINIKLVVMVMVVVGEGGGAVEAIIF
jgi:hypothetical protein